MFSYIKYWTAKTNFLIFEILDFGPGYLWSTHYSDYNDVWHDICYNIPYSSELLHCGGNGFTIQLYGWNQRNLTCKLNKISEPTT